jgi:hypothetical protein
MLWSTYVRTMSMTTAKLSPAEFMAVVIDAASG